MGVYKLRGTFAAAVLCAIAAAVMLAVPALAGTPNEWSPAGSLTTGRYEQVAALLASGSVLVAGGQAGSSTLQSAEIYDPATDSWSGAAQMSTARASAVGVTLPNGNVLVAGGSSTSSNSGALNTAEVYNPTSNTWTAAANTMSSARYAATATLLANGDVLVAGGEDASGDAVTTADLYVPSTNSFTPAHAMGTARYLASASLAGNGDVLVAGGFGTSDAVLTSGEVYDPTADTWTPVANSMSSPRVDSQAVTLPGGSILVAGGESEQSPTQAITATTDIYNPTTNSFTAGASMGTSRLLFAMTSLADGRVLASGGVTITDTTEAIAQSSEIYDPSSNTWTPTGALLTPTAALTTTLLPDGQVLAAGGSADLSNGSTAAELFTPTSKPSAPLSVSATAGNGSAQVVFVPPASDGGLAVEHYTVTASTGQSAVTLDGGTFITVAGLANGIPVTFSVTATNALGTSPPSAPSAAVTPTASAPVTVLPDTAPKVKVTGLAGKLKLKAFLKGIKFKITPSKAASLKVSLFGTVNKATIAKAFNLTLASTSTKLSSSARTVKLVPAKKLVGKPKKVKVEIVIVATDAARLSSTTMKTITVRR